MARLCVPTLHGSESRQLRVPCVLVFMAEPPLKGPPNHVRHGWSHVAMSVKTGLRQSTDSVASAVSFRPTPRRSLGGGSSPRTPGSTASSVKSVSPQKPSESPQKTKEKLGAAGSQRLSAGSPLKAPDGSSIPAPSFGTRSSAACAFNDAPGESLPPPPNRPVTPRKIASAKRQPGGVRTPWKGHETSKLTKDDASARSPQAQAAQGKTSATSPQTGRSPKEQALEKKPVSPSSPQAANAAQRKRREASEQSSPGKSPQKAKASSSQQARKALTAAAAKDPATAGDTGVAAVIAAADAVLAAVVSMQRPPSPEHAPEPTAVSNDIDQLESSSCMREISPEHAASVAFEVKEPTAPAGEKTEDSEALAGPEAELTGKTSEDSEALAGSEAELRGKTSEVPPAAAEIEETSSQSAEAIATSGAQAAVSLETVRIGSPKQKVTTTAVADVGQTPDQSAPAAQAAISVETARIGSPRQKVASSTSPKLVSPSRIRVLPPDGAAIPMAAVKAVATVPTVPGADAEVLRAVAAYATFLGQPQTSATPIWQAPATPGSTTPCVATPAVATALRYTSPPMRLAPRTTLSPAPGSRFGLRVAGRSNSPARRLQSTAGEVTAAALSAGKTAISLSEQQHQDRSAPRAHTVAAAAPSQKTPAVMPGTPRHDSPRVSVRTPSPEKALRLLTPRGAAETSTACASDSGGASTVGVPTAPAAHQVRPTSYAPAVSQGTPSWSPVCWPMSGVSANTGHHSASLASRAPSMAMPACASGAMTPPPVAVAMASASGTATPQLSSRGPDTGMRSVPVPSRPLSPSLSIRSNRAVSPAVSMRSTISGMPSWMRQATPCEPVAKVAAAAGSGYASVPAPPSSGHWAALWRPVAPATPCATPREVSRDVPAAPVLPLQHHLAAPGGLSVRAASPAKSPQRGPDVHIDRGVSLESAMNKLVALQRADVSPRYHTLGGKQVRKQKLQMPVPVAVKTSDQDGYWEVAPAGRQEFVYTI
eukprot:TRINITY_DN13032_c0_g1_i1.p1 TRINITY_DN13032_c0_g1~~TRINITY_DN13032_c0_g1_i1.p1  ORF type:complete len:994 (-),score=160.47 TRINITY_DN13032_c0_g1_i1:51-3032(-)